MLSTIKSIELLQERLKKLDNSVTSDELENLAKAVVALSKVDTVDDILDFSDKKLKEIVKHAANKENIITNSDTESVNHEKNSSLEELFAANISESLRIKERYEEGVEELNKLATDIENLNDVAIGSSITSEIHKKGEEIEFNSEKHLPFIFGVLSRYDDYFGTANFTSELGTWYNSGADYMLQLLSGCHSYTSNYAGFYLEPKLCYLQGNKGTFIKKKNYLKHQLSSSQYTYPYAALGVLFVKNVTEEDITSTISFGGSSHWSSNYEGASMFVGVSNNATESVSWSNVYSYSTSSSGFSGSASVTVPANTTVAVILYTSSYYITGTSGYYTQFLSWYLTSIRSGFLVSGLEIDWKITRNAWQCKGFLNTYQLWQ